MAPKPIRVERQAKLHTEEVIEDWSSCESPPHIYVLHKDFKSHLSQELSVNEELEIRIQVPGKEVGGLDRRPLYSTYTLQDEHRLDGELRGRLDMTRVHSYILNTKAYKLEIFAGDELQVWSSDQLDYFALGLVTPKCAICCGDTSNSGSLLIRCQTCRRCYHRLCSSHGKAQPFQCLCCMDKERALPRQQRQQQLSDQHERLSQRQQGHQHQQPAHDHQEPSQQEEPSSQQQQQQQEQLLPGQRRLQQQQQQTPLRPRSRQQHGSPSPQQRQRLQPELSGPQPSQQISQHQQSSQHFSQEQQQETSRGEDNDLRPVGHLHALAPTRFARKRRLTQVDSSGDDSHDGDDDDDDGDAAAGAGDDVPGTDGTDSSSDGDRSHDYEERQAKRRRVYDAATAGARRSPPSARHPLGDDEGCEDGTGSLALLQPPTKPLLQRQGHGQEPRGCRCWAGDGGGGGGSGAGAGDGSASPAEVSKEAAVAAATSSTQDSSRSWDDEDAMQEEGIVDGALVLAAQGVTLSNPTTAIEVATTEATGAATAAAATAATAATGAAEAEPVQGNGNQEAVAAAVPRAGSTPSSNPRTAALAPLYHESTENPGSNAVEGGNRGSGGGAAAAAGSDSSSGSDSGCGSGEAAAAGGGNALNHRESEQLLGRGQGAVAAATPVGPLEGLNPAGSNGGGDGGAPRSATAAVPRIPEGLGARQTTLSLLGLGGSLPGGSGATAPAGSLAAAVLRLTAARNAAVAGAGRSTAAALAPANGSSAAAAAAAGRRKDAGGGGGSSDSGDNGGPAEDSDPQLEALLREFPVSPYGGGLQAAAAAAERAATAGRPEPNARRQAALPSLPSLPASMPEFLQSTYAEIQQTLARGVEAESLFARKLRQADACWQRLVTLYGKQKARLGRRCTEMQRLQDSQARQLEQCRLQLRRQADELQALRLVSASAVEAQTRSQAEEVRQRQLVSELQLQLQAATSEKAALEARRAAVEEDLARLRTHLASTQQELQQAEEARRGLLQQVHDQAEEFRRRAAEELEDVRHRHQQELQQAEEARQRLQQLQQEQLAAARQEVETVRAQLAAAAVQGGQGARGGGSIGGGGGGGGLTESTGLVYGPFAAQGLPGRRMEPPEDASRDITDRIYIEQLEASAARLRADVMRQMAERIEERRALEAEVERWRQLAKRNPVRTSLDHAARHLTYHPTQWQPQSQSLGRFAADPDGSFASRPLQGLGLGSALAAAPGFADPDGGIGSDGAGGSGAGAGAGQPQQQQHQGPQPQPLLHPRIEQQHNNGNINLCLSPPAQRHQRQHSYQPYRAQPQS